MMMSAFDSWFIPFGIIMIIGLLWWSTYFIRERWRLSLTSKQIVARQLFPRPFTFFTRDLHFPLNKVEGLTTGPRAFRTILLVGIFLSTNLGINLIQTGISLLADPTHPDLPVSIDIAVQLLSGIGLTDLASSITRKGEQIAYDFNNAFESGMVILGVFFSAFGVIMVLFTLPRRQHIQIRVRHGADFKLNAGIPSSFWKKCYSEIYKEETADAPDAYKKLKFQWFKDEKVQTIADLEQTVHLNRIISLFVIWIGLTRLEERVKMWISSPETIFDTSFMLWIGITLIDIFLAVTAIRFSKKKNELIITNKRIIFAREEKDISGAFGRRMYLLSDIRRSDVAGFNFKKIRAFSFGYLIMGMFLLGMLSLYFSFYPVFFDNILIKIIILISVMVSFIFINQTYVQFDLRTKGGEVWIMRHQLSNPITILREIVGGEDNNILTAIFTNRLEENEIIDVVQTIRSEELSIPMKFQTHDKQGENSIQSATVGLEDLLLEDEDIVLMTNVSRKVPRRVLTLSIASVTILIWIIPGIAIPASMIDKNPIYNLSNFIAFFSVVYFTGVLILILFIWIKYYSFFKASLIITENRVFFQDRKKPLRLLYLFGIHDELVINESLRDQIHSTYTNRQFTQKIALKSFLHHCIYWLIWLLIMGFMIDLLSELLNYLSVHPIESVFITYLLQFFIIVIGIVALKVAWHSSNAFVELIKGYPKKIFNAKGVGVHYTIPFLKKDRASEVNYSMWSGQRFGVKRGLKL